MKKKVMIILTTLSILLAIALPAAAAQRQVMATYSGSTILLNGAKIKAEPVEINGTTYLPLRSVAEALGLEVEWNGATNSINLTTSSYVTPSNNSNNSPNTIGYNRTNPAPIGASQTVTVESYVYGTYNATITLNDVIRGERAWEMIQEANRFNDAAKDGYEYVLAYFKVNINTNSKDASVHISESNFTAFDSTNSKYKTSYVVEPEPKLSGEAYAGGSVEGWAAFEISVNDSAPKVVFEQNYDGTGGLWFSLK